MGEVSEGFAVSYNTLKYGKSQFTNASYIFIMILIFTFIAVFSLVYASIKLGKSNKKYSNKLAILPVAFLMLIIPMTVWYMLTANLKISVSKCWQADYFVFTCFISVLLVISLYKWSIPSGKSVQDIWAGVFKICAFTWFALLATPVFVWSVSETDGIKGDAPVYMCVGFMIVLIYFTMITVLTKGSIFSFMLPAVLMNGASMFYYEIWPTAIFNGLLYNLTIAIYFLGSILANQFFTSRKAKYTAGIYSIIIVMYAFTVLFFWPALSIHYTGDMSGHSYSSFHSESFYPS